MKTNEDSKLLLFYLLFGGVGEWLGVLFACLVKYFTVLNCCGVELYVGVEVFPPIFRMESSK